MGAWEGIWLGMQAVEDAKYKNVQLDLQERKMALLEKETEEAARLAQMDTLFKNFSTSRGYNYKKSSPNSGVEIETGIEYLKKLGVNDDIISKFSSTKNPTTIKEGIEFAKKLQESHMAKFNVVDPSTFSVALNNAFTDAVFNSPNSEEIYKQIIEMGKEIDIDTESPLFQSGATRISESQIGSAVMPSIIESKTATVEEIKTVRNSTIQLNKNAFNTMSEGFNTIRSKATNELEMSEEERSVIQTDFAKFQKKLEAHKNDEYLLNNTFNNASKEVIVKTYPYFKGNAYFNSMFDKLNPNDYMDLTSQNNKDPYFFVKYLIKNKYIPVGFNFKIYDGEKFQPKTFMGTGVNK